MVTTDEINRGVQEAFVKIRRVLFADGEISDADVARIIRENVPLRWNDGADKKGPAQ